IGFKNDNQKNSCRNSQNDSAEREQPLRYCPSQRFNKPDSYHNLFIVSWITRECLEGEGDCSGEILKKKT
ncbi:hypothetical protein T05_16027, partial [Trichinella murrelli]